MTPDELLHEWCNGRTTYQAVEDAYDHRDQQARRRLAQYQPERDPRGWLVLIAYAVAVGVICWFTRGGL